MNKKSSLRVVLYCLVVLMLVANTSVAAASPETAKQSGKAFTVYPTGGDDTANIQHAFDQAVVAGPGSTVKLSAGNFRTRFIEAWNFDGTFKGAGQNLTIIDTFADQDCQALIDNNHLPSLFNFYQGNVRVADLGFHITPAAPCHPYIFGGLSPDVISWISVLAITPSPFVPETDCAAIQKERVSGSITRLTIRGEQGLTQDGETDPENSNIGEAILLGGSYTTKDIYATDCNFFINFAKGTFSITNNIIQNSQVGIVMEYAYNSPVLVSGNSYDLGTLGLSVEDNSGSKIEVSANHIKRSKYGGIWVWHGGDGKLPYMDSPSVYDIHDNEVEAYETSGWWTTGIMAWDTDHLGINYLPPTGKTFVLVIRNNRIKLTSLNPTEESDNLWGVWLEGVDDSLIAHNKISGAGTNAIYAGSWGPSRRDMILGNDLTGFSSNASSPYKIVLEWGTEKYIVAGEPVVNVANYGTDNLIAGTKFQTLRKFVQGAPDAMKHIFGPMKRLKVGGHPGQ